MAYGDFVPIEEPKVKPQIFTPNIEGFYKDQSIFLICNGPSINDMNIVPLDTRQTFGINNGGILRPKFWTAQDAHGKFLDCIWDDPTIMKIVPHPRARQRGGCPSMVYHEKSSRCDASTWLDDDCICWGVPSSDGHKLNTMVAALHIIYKLGFRTVYIIGADFNMIAEDSYFFEERGKANSNNNLYNLTNAYLTKLDTYCRDRGYNIYNCTDGGNLTAFRRLEYIKALQATEIEATRETYRMYNPEPKGILYYSHNILDGTPLNDACRDSLNVGLPITSVTHTPIELGRNIIFDGRQNLGAMIEQIILGLESITDKYVYFVEHDCLYHPSHFDHETDGITYNTNMWRLCPLGYRKCPDRAPVLSTCSGPRKILLAAMQSKLVCYNARKEKYKNHKYVKMIYEPGRSDRLKFKTYASEQPCIDVRHNRNSSGRGWSKRNTFIDDLPYWGSADSLRRSLDIC